VVTSGVVFHITVEPFTKFIPPTASVKPEPPAAMAAGLSDAIAGPSTMNVLAEEAAALEFCTVTLCGPAEASWVVATVAAREVALPYTVESGVVPHITVDPLTKFTPVTVSVNWASPAPIAAGESNVIVGPLTMNALADEEAALEFRIVTFCDPAASS
jgi:hypothetical protein